MNLSLIEKERARVFVQAHVGDCDEFVNSALYLRAPRERQMPSWTMCAMCCMWIVRKVEKLMLACTSARISIGKVAVNPRLPWLDHKC